MDRIPRRTGAPETALFYQFTQSVSGSSGGRMGNLVVYRDVPGEIEIERTKAEIGRLRSELETTDAFGGIIGSSPGMCKVSELMRRVVDSDVSVWVTGESGGLTCPPGARTRLRQRRRSLDWPRAGGGASRHLISLLP